VNHSRRLRVLGDAGLVASGSAGNGRVHRLDGEGVGAVGAQLEWFWSRALAAYKAVVEQATKEGLMTTQAQEASVRTSIVVEAPIERAFSVFTEDFGGFKPPEHNMLGVEIAETVFEPRVGGHLFDRGVDGSECRWARVLAYEPPHRVVFSWDISPQWQIETDLEKTSEVEVQFISEAPERTRVELEHRNLERHGEGWEGVREGVGGGEGWPLYLQRYAELLKD
jgi:uncharacterized protein YndB with AHSA1/START domain